MEPAKKRRMDHADPLDGDGEMYDVFMIYSSNDKDMVIKDIYPHLVHKKFSVHYDDNFTIGKMVISNITEAIRRSKKILMVLTQEALDSPWCKFELLLALEKTQQTNIHSVVLLLKGLTPEKVSIIDVLRIAPKVEMDDNDNWILDLTEKLRAEISVKDILPAGNVAHGQAWSHFFGFLKYLLPVIEEKVKETEWYQTNPTQTSCKIYEMVPESCEYLSGFSDDRIKHVGNLGKIKYERAGNTRYVTASVYSVQDDDGSLYYCVCEYPSVVSAIYQMEHNHLAQLTKEDRRLQLARFYYTMNAILTHSEFSDCYGKARVLLYNEQRTKPSTVLLDAIKEDLKIQKRENNGPLNVSVNTKSTYRQCILIEFATVQHDPFNLYLCGMLENLNVITDFFGPLERLSSVDVSEQQTYEYDVYVSYLSHDANKAAEILEYLNKKGMTCFDGHDSENQNLLHTLQDALQKSRYLVFILSKDSLHEDWFSFSCLEALHNSIMDNKICVIPVLNGVAAKQIPEALGWVTYIEDKGDNQYLDRLYNTCKDVSIQVETLLPAGNVADGLAWAYVVNYLRFVLLDPEVPENSNEEREKGFTEKIDQQFEEKGIINYICPKKLYILIPQSCNCPPSLAAANPDDPRISKFHNFFAHYRDQTGTINRKYNCDIYKIQVNEQQVYYFVGQYAAPVQCLNEMEKTKIAGLRGEEMCKEAERFCEISKNILAGPAAGECANRCEFIYFDDSSRLLADVMIEKIENDTTGLTE